MQVESNRKKLSPSFAGKDDREGSKSSSAEEVEGCGIADQKMEKKS